MLTRTRIRELLDSHGLSPSRALGQNFLCDPAMVDKIVRTAGVDSSTSVVEIGPGLGSLTLGLCRAGAKVTAVEVDRYLLPPLREVTAEFLESGQLTIINADVLELDWSSVLASSPAWSVVANLPYNIATPLILDLLADQPALEQWVVMVQREAGERLVADAGSRIYGIPSVLLAFWAEARLAGSVPPDVFLPRPNVDSVLVKVARRPTPVLPGEFDHFARVVRTAFGQRRKMLRRSLSALPTSVFDVAAIDPTARPEQLSLDDWVRLVQAVISLPDELG